MTFFIYSSLRMSLNRNNLKTEDGGRRVDKEEMQGQVQCLVMRLNLSRHTKHAIVPGSWWPLRRIVISVRRRARCMVV